MADWNADKILAALAAAYYDQYGVQIRFVPVKDEKKEEDK